MAFNMVTLVAVMLLTFQVRSTIGENLPVFPGGIHYLTSPNYPSNYYNNANLFWMIYSPSDFIVKVTILNATMDQCCDFVEITDGMLTSSPSLVKFYSMPNQTEYYSTGQYMYIRFYTNGNVTSLGFMLIYEAIPTFEMCANISVDLVAVPGQAASLTSPSYPSNYYNNSDCGQLITAPGSFIVKVDVTDVSLQVADIVQIFDGVSTSSPTLVTLISMPNQTVYYSSGQFMYIRFFTDMSVTSTGFRLAFQAIPASGMCAVTPANLSAVPGEVVYLTSPSYPVNYYLNADCGRLIIAPVGFVVKVDVMDVSLELDFDFVQIFDGMSTSSPTLVKFYSMPNQRVYYSSGQYMYIRFYSDYSITSSGFRLTYEAVSQQPVTTSAPVITTPITTARTSVCSVNGTALLTLPSQVDYLRFPNQPSIQITPTADG